MISITQSMTGYGEIHYQDAALCLHIAIRTLNSKHLDITYHTPKTLLPQEHDWSQTLKAQLLRGEVTVSIEYEQREVPQEQATFNETLFKHYYHRLSNLAHTLQAKQSDPFACAWQALQVVTPPVTLPLSANNLATLHAQFTKALTACVASRQQEGALLHEQLQTCITQLQEHLIAMAPELKERTEAMRTRLQERIALRTAESTPEQWQQEIRYYMDKIDITEEIVRLNSHINFFQATLQQPSSIGKKLTFIIQEIGRELNTIGAKAQHSDLQHRIVHMKQTLEAMKEQTHNLV